MPSSKPRNQGMDLEPRKSGNLCLDPLPPLFAHFAVRRAFPVICLFDFSTRFCHDSYA